jgi:hypothetical protein
MCILVQPISRMTVASQERVLVKEPVNYPSGKLLSACLSFQSLYSLLGDGHMFWARIN